MRVLICDDNVDAAETLRLVLDIGMPGMAGQRRFDLAAMTSVAAVTTDGGTRRLPLR